jgi:GntR family transcriptional regulator, sialic acid-inducible nan operon repressor
MQVSPIRRRKLSEEVAARLEAMIQESGYQPGDQLPSERELMKQFGVGRPAVREALFSLQTMGLVAVSSGERARVTRPTPKLVIESLAGTARLMLSEPDGIRHFQNARTLFEIGLARHAAQHATEADLADLRRALEENRRSIGNIRRFEQTDMAFHYVLAVIPRNPIFTAIHAAIAEWLMEQRTMTLTYPGQNEIAYRAHLAITEAIAARDPDRSERVIRAHLDQVASLYWQVVGEEGGEHVGLRDHGGFPPETPLPGGVPPAD